MSLLARPTIAFAAVRMPAQYMPSGPSAIRALIREAIWRLLTTQIRSFASTPIKVRSCQKPPNRLVKSVGRSKWVVLLVPASLSRLALDALSHDLIDPNSATHR